jgi:hypothetical protein
MKNSNQNNYWGPLTCTYDVEVTYTYVKTVSNLQR